jgi:hypothetical protein
LTGSPDGLEPEVRQWLVPSTPIGTGCGAT